MNFKLAIISTQALHYIECIVHFNNVCIRSLFAEIITYKYTLFMTVLELHVGQTPYYGYDRTIYSNSITEAGIYGSVSEKMKSGYIHKKL